MIFHILISQFKIIISKKPTLFDNMTIYANVNANNAKFERKFVMSCFCRTETAHSQVSRSLNFAFLNNAVDLLTITIK